MEKEIWMIKSRKRNKEIIEKEELWFISPLSVKSQNLHVIDLEKDSLNVSLFITENLFEQMLNDKYVICESSGYWVSANDSKITWFRENWEKIPLLSLYP